MAVRLLFRIDIGFDEGRGYGAVVFDVANDRQKGIKGNSIEQLVSRIRNVVIEEARKKRNFPTESEARSILSPGDAGYNAPPNI
jgi:hypothetical protein